ncbi:MAG: leucine-rich repeat domain-containing protein, partial [Chitinophagaceae bacterium]
SEKIMLQATGTSQQVPATGGTITIDNIKLTFPANSIVRPGGAAYTGQIHVVARYINPSGANFPYLIPGMLSGLNETNEINALQSFGMANVELTDPTGNKLVIASGKTVKMELPAPAGSPATIPLWHFNEKYGIWIQQGTATKSGNFYIAEVNHFSIWNLDLEFNDFELNLLFQNTSLIPISNLRVDVYRPNNSFVKGFYTDNAGEATLINCSSNEALILKIAYPCDTLVYNLLPVTQTRSETITVNSPTMQGYQFTGTLFQCNTQMLPNHPYQIFLNGANSFTILNGITDAQGHINTGTAIPACIGSPVTAQASAYYNNQFYFSSVSLVNPGLNNYNATLCDSSGTAQLYNDSDIVNIPDPSLRQKVREIISKPTGNIYYADVKNVQTIRAYTIAQVQSLIGLQYFTGMDTLELSSINGVIHAFTDLTPIKDLTRLKYLDLARGSLTNITPLQGLTNLTELYLSQNAISDITPLQNLTGLKTLWLPVNPLQSITPLQNLTALVDLSLNTCQLTSLSALQNLTSIKYLNLAFNPITDVTPLQNLTAVVILNLSECNVSNIAPLQNMTAMQTIRLDSNNVSNLAPLQNMTALIFADLSDNNVSTLPSFNANIAFRTVDLSDNQITDLSPLVGQPSLVNVTLRNNQITDLTPLQNISTLRLLELSGNSITNLAPLGGINGLQTLYLYNNNLTNITPMITSNPNLTKFYILQGNTVPGTQVTSFQNTHPSCQVL